MLTYPSDSLPQIVCPMDEHAIPPNSFCSAPPHSEPPPPLLPLSSITPSCAKNGISGHRRSGRIQEIRAQTPKKQSNKDDRATQTLSRQNPSPSKRQKESANMVQVSQSKQQRVEFTNVHEKQNETQVFGEMSYLDSFYCRSSLLQKRHLTRHLSADQPDGPVIVCWAGHAPAAVWSTESQDGFDLSVAAEHQNKQKDQKSPEKKPNVSAAEHVVEQFAVDTTQNLDTTKSNMDTCGGLAVGHSFENVSAPKGWVIGPLFQSFKSKMASFTDIVMSPVKLFRANSPPPCPDHPHKLDECELLADGASDTFHPEAQSENQDSKANRQEETVALKYSKKLLFDVDLPTCSSEQTDECAITQKENNSPDSVPLLSCPSPCFVSESVIKPSTLLQPSVDVSASLESKLKTPGAMEDQKGKVIVLLKPLPRKCPVTRSGVKKVTSTPEVEKDECELSDKQFSHVKSNKADSTDCPQPDDGRKIESLVRPSQLNNINDGAKGRMLRPSSDAQQLNSEIYSAASLGRAKRGVELDCQTQDFVKRKRVTADSCTRYTKRQGPLNVASDSVTLRPQRREVVSPNPIVDKEETPKPALKRPAVTTRASKKGKGGQEVLNTQRESPSDAMLVCSVDKSSDASENKEKGSSKVKPKRLKTTSGVCKPDVNIDSMDLAITATAQAKQELLSEVLIRPAIKPLQSTSKRRNINKKPVKRKSPIQSTTESDSTLFSTSSVLSMEHGDLTPTDFNTPGQGQKEESAKKPSKRPKRGFRDAVKSSASGGNEEIKQCIHSHHSIAKENQPEEGKGKLSMDPVYFEMTPSESNQQPSQSYSDCYVQLNKEVKHVTGAAPVSDEVFPIDADSSVGGSGLRSSARRVKPRRANNQRRKCRVLQSRTRKGEGATSSITMEDADLATASSQSAGNSLSRNLSRSYSCPEIPSLRPHDTPWASSLYSPHHSRIHTPHQHQSSYTPSLHHAHKSLRRARRHTVCSVEVEREIAPLCLRKEVYPSRRSLPYDRTSQHLSPSLTLSPSTSLSALASCFLSSPLAFLSKKAERSAASPSTSSHVSSPTSSSPIYPMVFLKRIDSSSAPLDYSSSGNPLDCEIERRRQSEEEDDGEDTSSSSQEFEDVGLREEKALSDSEIKVVQKQERGKVSSIRIRKTLPKPQNNLTPMGLPKPIRLKKKEFSLEEIYTNKNFSKPPESRLETIFEVPLNRRNGSESWFGQRRLKRFMEFLDAGEARKPKKPLVGIGKAGNSSSRTRRGGYAKDEPPLSVQDVDSLLCAKLDQLNLWLIEDQRNS